MLRKFGNLYHRIKNLNRYDGNLNKEDYNKLNYLCSRLEKIQHSTGLKVAGTTLALLIGTTTLNAQITFNEVTGAGNPFDGVDVGYQSSPVFEDIDRDGDLDCFIGERDGTIKYFQNDGNGTYTEITGAGNPFDGIEFGMQASPSFADIDRDGDLDCFIGEGDGIVNYYQNDGNGVFSEITGAGNPFDGIDVGYASVPAFEDIDRDGDLDCFMGEYDGTIKYYQNDGEGAFAEITGAGNPFNGVDVDYYSSPLFEDIDHDGDLDCFIGNNNGDLKYYQNNGSGTFTEITGAGNPFDGIDIGSVSSPVFTDIDRDGDMDCFIGDNSGFIYYYRNETPKPEISYTENPANNPFAGLDIRRKFTFADIDRDGDMDCFTGEGDGTIKYYQNDGSGSFTEITGAGNPFNGVDVGGNSAPTFADIDRDGDLDCFIGESEGFINYYQNDGTGTFSAITGAGNPFDGVDIGDQSVPAFADIDRDGDLDCFVGETDGTLIYYQNNGSGAFTEITGAGNPFNGVDVGDYSTPTFEDIDNDGDLDCIIGLFDGYLMYYQNDGNGAFTKITGTENPLNQVNTPINSTPAFVDIDRDGDLDCFIGNSFGTILYYKCDRFTTWNGTIWSGGTPRETLDVVADADLTTSEDMECENMTVNAAVNFTADHIVTVNGDLLLSSDATGTASILGNNNVTVAGNTTVQNYLLDYGAKALFWHYIAIPVDVSGGTITSNVFGTPYNNSGTDYYALYYDESITNYVGITDNTTVLTEQMRGYAVPKNSAETLEFTGDLVDGTQTVALSRDNTGYNLVGNPYPSGLNLGNIDAGLTGVTPTNLATTVWIRENGGFNEYNWQSGAAVSGSFTGTLPPMQAAWFRVTDGQTVGSLQVENTARVHNNEIIYKASENNLLRFSLTDGSNIDNGAIGLYANATIGMDNYDSEKMFDDNESNPQVFMHIDNKDIAINGLPANQQELIVPIGIKTITDGHFTLSFSNITEIDMEYEIFLKDNLTGDLIDLRKNSEYEFYTSAINSTSRLSVIISKSSTGVEELTDDFVIYYSNNSIIITANSGTQAIASVYDVSGKIVSTKNMNLVPGKNQIEINQPDGVYIVNIRNSNINITRKVVIR